MAAAGYLAVVPDYFRGDAFKISEGENPMGGFTEWLSKHPPVRFFNSLHPPLLCATTPTSTCVQS